MKNGVKQFVIEAVLPTVDIYGLGMTLLQFLGLCYPVRVGNTEAEREFLKRTVGDRDFLKRALGERITKWGEP
jgi:hypothetical protein